MKAIINIENEILTIDGYKGQVDLSEYQGSEPNLIRVYDDGEKNLVIDPPMAFWLLAEVLVPAKKMEPVSEEEDAERGRVAIKSEDVEVLLWELP